MSRFFVVGLILAIGRVFRKVFGLQVIPKSLGDMRSRVEIDQELEELAIDVRKKTVLELLCTYSVCSDRRCEMSRTLCSSLNRLVLSFIVRSNLTMIFRYFRLPPVNPIDKPWH